MELDTSRNPSPFGLLLHSIRRTYFLGVFFVLVWPTFNLFIVSTLLVQLGRFDSTLVLDIALRLYTLFGVSFCLVQLMQRIFPVVLAEERFWPQLLLHVLPIFLLSYFFGPTFRPVEVAELPHQTVLPIAIVFFQITLYVLVKTLLIQRDRYLAAQLNLRQAQINILRSQTNPHFLFNTLNLLASEIGRHPDTARDIVYDLADLLRDSMRAAEREFSSLAEELRLVKLYLSLQQKRFPERLDFTIDVDEESLPLRVPSLILQPIVENVIKHVVARSTGVTRLQLNTQVGDERLVITVSDNGSELSASALRPAGGLRIVEESLALQYGGQAELRLETGTEGCRVKVMLPLAATRP